MNETKNAQLSHKDFKTILKYYKIKIPKSKKLTRKKAVNILAQKLCKCVKKLQRKTKKRQRKKLRNPATRICSASIFNKRGIKHGRFNCKKKPKLYVSKKNKRYLTKTRKNFTMKYK